MELAPCRVQQGLPRLYRLGWALSLPGSGVCCWNTVQSWALVWGGEHSVHAITRHYRKTEGKAAATSELPPEYLTSPLSQQSQVSGCPIGDLVILTYLWIPLLTTSSSVHFQLPPKRDETALQEEEELQLAIALSQSEAEEKERMVCLLLESGRGCCSSAPLCWALTDLWTCPGVSKAQSLCSKRVKAEPGTGCIVGLEKPGLCLSWQFSLLQRQKTYSMYPKAEPTPVTSSAPPVSTLYSPPVVCPWSGWTQEHCLRFLSPSLPWLCPI